MTLHNRSRTALESWGRPSVSEQDDEIALVNCFDTFKLWVLKSDVSVTPSLLNHGYWESWITSWFTKNIDYGDFVVDIGANCGYYTMLFEHLTGGDAGRVVAYEASSKYVELLHLTRAANNAHFIVEPVAVSDAPGDLTLTYPGEYTGSASIAHGFDAKWGAEHSESVKATTLDIDFDGMDSPDLIKIDAESAEELIWNGAANLLARDDAPVVVMEYSPTGVYSPEFPDRLFEYGHITRIDFDGIEQQITPDYLRGLSDWDMIVIRKKS